MRYHGWTVDTMLGRDVDESRLKLSYFRSLTSVDALMSSSHSRYVVRKQHHASVYNITASVVDNLRRREGAKTTVPHQPACMQPQAGCYGSRIRPARTIPHYAINYG